MIKSSLQRHTSLLGFDGYVTRIIYCNFIKSSIKITFIAVSDHNIIISSFHGLVYFSVLQRSCFRVGRY